MARQDTESEINFEEETEVVSLVGADSVEDEGTNSDDDQGVSDVEGIQMHAEASTPEWSDVSFPARLPRRVPTARLSSLALGNILPHYGCWT